MSFWLLEISDMKMTTWNLWGKMEWKIFLTGKFTTRIRRSTSSSPWLWLYIYFHDLLLSYIVFEGGTFRFRDEFSIIRCRFDCHEIVWLDNSSVTLEFACVRGLVCAPSKHWPCSACRHIPGPILEEERRGEDTLEDGCDSENGENWNKEWPAHCEVEKEDGYEVDWIGDQPKQWHPFHWSLYTWILTTDV